MPLMILERNYSWLNVTVTQNVSVYQNILVTGYIYWYIIIVSANYSFIVRPICKNYLLSFISYRWCYIGLVEIIVKFTVFSDFIIQVEVD